MTPQIIFKIQREIDAGFKTEAQVLYVLAEIRKIIEQEGTREDFYYLNFHCDWALHSKLKGPTAQSIINQFNPLSEGLRKNEPLNPTNEALEISKMYHLLAELSAFLRSHGITDFASDLNIYSKFLYFYSLIIQDAPLVLRSDSTSRIAKIVISTEEATRSVFGQKFYKVSWNLTDIDGNSGGFEIFNSFEAKGES